MKFKTVLVLSPHPDDLEVGCGGSVARLVEEGADVVSLAVAGINKQIIQECRVATERLGVKIHSFGRFKVREFNKRRQDILEMFRAINVALSPDLVFMPSLNDIHQDHQVVAQEGLRAFKNTTLLGYEEPWNNLSFNTQAFIKLEKKHVDKKVAALNCYASQKHRKYLNEEFIRSLAKVRGVQIGSEYAEAFEIIRWVI